MFWRFNAQNIKIDDGKVNMFLLQHSAKSEHIKLTIQIKRRLKLNSLGLTAFALSKDNSAPFATSTVIGNMGFSEGVHYWEVICPIYCNTICKCEVQRCHSLYSHSFINITGIMCKLFPHKNHMNFARSKCISKRKF